MYLSFRRAHRFIILRLLDRYSQERRSAGNNGQVTGKAIRSSESWAGGGAARRTSRLASAEVLCHGGAIRGPLQARGNVRPLRVHWPGLLCDRLPRAAPHHQAGGSGQGDRAVAAEPEAAGEP
eukprot:scaffold21494_cov55-Phaeocystis_antarctica.AAC.2